MEVHGKRGSPKVTIQEVLEKCIEIMTDKTIRFEGDPGCEAFQWQMLHEALSKAKACADGHVEVSFITNAMNILEFDADWPKTGIVLWVPSRWLEADE